jgi:class 3 adenylate cyclase
MGLDEVDTLTVLKARRRHAERRQVTVMFAALGGSTALSARMDPEDLREAHFRLSGVCRRLV